MKAILRSQVEMPYGREMGPLGADQARYSARQAEVLDGLEAIFTERGFRAVTVGELATKIRCSRETLYTLAPTKEELFLLVLDRMWQRLSGSVDRAMQDSAGDLAAQIEAVVVEGAVIFFKPGFSSAFVEDVERYGPARRLFDDQLTNTMTLVAELVDAGIRTRQFRAVDPRLAAEVIALAAFHMVGGNFPGIRLKGFHRIDDAQAATREAIRMVLLGIMEQPSPDLGAGSRSGS